MFPTYRFEPAFTETDHLWRANESETDAAFAVRAKAVLDDVFASDPKTWLSITAHSGAITRLLAALNHRPFRLATGQIIPVLVKAEVVDLQPSPAFEAHEPYSTCDAPPLASVAGQGCVCPTMTMMTSTTTTVVPTATATTTSEAGPEPTESEPAECVEE